MWIIGSRLGGREDPRTSRSSRPLSIVRAAVPEGTGAVAMVAARDARARQSRQRRDRALAPCRDEGLPEVRCDRRPSRPRDRLGAQDVPARHPLPRGGRPDSGRPPPRSEDAGRDHRVDTDRAHVGKDGRALTSTQAGALLVVPAATARRVRLQAARPLPVSVRRAFRRALRGDRDHEVRKEAAHFRGGGVRSSLKIISSSGALRGRDALYYLV